MSAGISAPYYPLKSFNGANNWQFGWYNDRQLSFDPSQGGQMITLATFVDYGKSNKNNPVLIMVGSDTFLQYNRAKGFNVQTQANLDQVTIVQQQSSGTSLLGAVDATSSPQFAINDFDGSGRTLLIIVCSSGSGNNNNPDWMALSIGFDQNYCIQNANQFISPTFKPTRRRRRTRAPSASPSMIA